MKKIYLILISLVSNPLYAANLTGEIESMVTGRLGHEVYVRLSSGTNSCESEHPSGYHYAISLRDHEAGDAIYSTLLAAHFANKTITIIGTNECTVHPGIENMAHIVLN